MATYSELHSLFTNDELRKQASVAVMVSANDLISGTPTAEEQKWAASVFSSPRSEGIKALMAILAENKSASLAAITSATDSAVQAQVDAVVPSLVVAFNA